MVEKIHGKVDWDEVDCGPEFPWLKIEQGDNRLRIITSPYQFWVHWSKDVAGQTARLNCCLTNCPECDRGKFKAEKRWVMAVLDKKTNKPHIMEVGKTIFRKIKMLVEDEEWGKPTQYDVNIKRGPKGQNPLYDVVAYSKKGLTDDEKAVAREFIKNLRLEDVTSPMTPEAMLEKLGMGGAAKAQPDTEGLDTSETADQPASSVDDDFDSLESGSDTSAPAEDDGLDFD